jgi:hypothetical protein
MSAEWPYRHHLNLSYLISFLKMVTTRYCAWLRTNYRPARTWYAFQLPGQTPTTANISPSSTNGADQPVMHCGVPLPLFSD